MFPSLDTYDWCNAFGEDNIQLRYERTLTYRNDETLSQEPFTREDVELIFGMSEGENDGPAWLIWGQLKDNRYFYIEAGCDYTGWDCQAGGSCVFSKDLEDMKKFGLTEEGRERLGVTL